MSEQGLDVPMMVVQYVCLLFSLSVHEAAHAFMADRCGDATGRLLGRATLNPIPHIDPLGTVVMPLLMLVTGGHFMFGWAKPVPFNPRNLRNIRRDTALVGLAGPLSNLILAIVFTLIMRVAVIIATGSAAVHTPLFYFIFLICGSMIMVNLVLMLFNIIPVPPLDGHHLLYPILPESGQRILEQIGPFGILIAILCANVVLRGPLEFLSHMAFQFASGGV